MKKAKDLHKKWLRKPGYQKAYDVLAGELDIAPGKQRLGRVAAMLSRF